MDLKYHQEQYQNCELELSEKVKKLAEIRTTCIAKNREPSLYERTEAERLITEIEALERYKKKSRIRM